MVKVSLGFCIMSGSIQSSIIIINEASFLACIILQMLTTDVFTHLQLKLCCLFGVPIFLNSSVNWDWEKKKEKHQCWAQLCTLVHPMQPDLATSNKQNIPASICVSVSWLTFN